MTLTEVKEALTTIDELHFVLPNGQTVPSHFHVTEVGSIDKHFIDCGGNIRYESVVNFQLFTAQDYDHRLQAEKLRAIVELSEKKLQLGNHAIEVEYQGDTIGKYGLSFDGSHFHLTTKQTACLANEACGLPANKPKKRLSMRDLQVTEAVAVESPDACEPSGCKCC